MPKISRNELAEIFADVEKAIAKWEASDGPTEHWIGGPTKAISEEVEEWIDILCGFCAVTDAEDDAKAIMLALDAFATEWNAFLDAREISRDAVRPSGTPELWGRLRDLRAAFTPRPRKLPEPIRDLMEMETPTPDKQICLMYGFIAPDGSPDFIKLQEEKRKPGTHFDADTWVHPSEARRQAEIDAKWAARTPPAESITKAAPKPRKIAHESIEELFAQGVDVQQIADMKDMLPEEVEAYARQHGLSTSGIAGEFAPDEAQARRNVLAAKRAETVPMSHPEIEDMDERILACNADGMKTKDIAEALQPTYPDLSWQKVAAIIRGATPAEPAAA